MPSTTATSCVSRTFCISTENRQFPEAPDRIDYAPSKTNAEIKRRNRNSDVPYFTKRDRESGKRKNPLYSTIIFNIFSLSTNLLACHISSSKRRRTYDKKIKSHKWKMKHKVPSHFIICSYKLLTYRIRRNVFCMQAPGYFILTRWIRQKRSIT